MRRLGTLPLLHQPGEKWLYNTGSYILGVLIARAAGQSFEAFMRERIFAPLGMKDSGFSVPPDKRDRLATSYWVNDKTGALDLYDSVAETRWAKPPAFADGGGGMVSTVDDYLAFAQMLLGKGKLGSTRILSRPAVELMTVDHLTPAQKAASAFLADDWHKRGWGFGVGITTGRDEFFTTPRRLMVGTAASARRGPSDPGEEMIADLLMAQRAQYPTFSPICSSISGLRPIKRSTARPKEEQPCDS